MAKTIAYLRCSTQEQADSRLGLEAQQARTLAYAAAMGWDSPEVVQDAGYSAKSLQRPGMALIMERIRNGAIERVVVSKLDRLTRSVRDLCHIVELCNEHRVALVSGNRIARYGNGRRAHGGAPAPLASFRSGSARL